MKRVAIVLLLTFATATAERGQSDKPKPELFREYLSATTLPLNAHIPAETCRTLIGQADNIVSTGKLKTVGLRDLRTASLNLRACATTDSLARIERDLAVGLYGEFISETDRREAERN